jgi:hypothetical protein
MGFQRPEGGSGPGSGAGGRAGGLGGPGGGNFLMEPLIELLGERAAE